MLLEWPGFVPLSPRSPTPCLSQLIYLPTHICWNTELAIPIYIAPNTTDFFQLAFILSHFNNSSWSQKMLVCWHFLTSEQQERCWFMQCMHSWWLHNAALYNNDTYSYGKSLTWLLSHGSHPPSLIPQAASVLTDLVTMSSRRGCSTLCSKQTAIKLLSVLPMTNKPFVWCCFTP